MAVATQALEAWFRAHKGYLHQNVRIAENTTSGVHYQTDVEIEPGATLASAPHTIALSYLNALVDDEFPVFKRQRHRFKVEAIGFFYLMAQWLNTPKSFWQPYLDTLPTPQQDLLQPLFYEDAEDVAWLEETDVWHTVGARKAVYLEYYEDGIIVLKEAGIDVRPYTWHLFKWAATIFTSRSFTSRALRPSDSKYWTTYKSTKDGRRQTVLLDMSHVPAEDLDFPVLIPGLDAANHNPEARIDWVFDPGRFSISTADRIPAGAEVFNNYGPKGNGELLIGYGFCFPDNPHDTVALTLKAPRLELQATLRNIHPGYFTASGEWSPEKTTFRLAKPHQRQDPSGIFPQLPEPLLELLIYILRDERGLAFQCVAEPCEYLDSEGLRYLPHIARMLVQSLSASVGRLDAVSLPSKPTNVRQQQAAIYRSGQVAILRGLIAALKKYTRSLIWQPTVETKVPTQPCLLRLEHFAEFVTSLGELDDAFLQGIEASANTAEIEQLRLAGWEEDVWVLLLCYLFLQRGASGAWMRSVWPEYIDLSDDPSEASEDTDMMDIVQTAALACSNSRWADGQWCVAFIARIGGKILQHDSFMIMCPTADGEDQARVCVVLYSHST